VTTSYYGSRSFVVYNKPHGSKYVFFNLKKIQIRNPIVFSPDDTNTSCSVGDHPFDVARSIIDRDIARLKERIRALKSRRNELSPISCLPAEILCNIFSLTEDKNLSSRRPESWTNFSQVSQHWRSSALSAPELWTNIPLNYPRWAHEMLIRSKMAKLTIRTGLKPRSLKSLNPKILETVKLCLYEMNRIEEINLTAAGSVLKEIFRDLPESAPQLHTLCINSPHRNFAAFQIDEDFIYDTERLKRVELINCKISWDSRLLTGLTRLTLENSLTANCSIIQVLHALQQMPALTDLHLKDSIPDYSPSTYPVVDLPCLRVLNVSCYSSGVDAMTTVLCHITFPHITFLNLTCRDNQSQIDFSNFLSVLTTKFLSSLVIQSLRLGFLDNLNDDTDGLEIELWAPPSSLISAPLIVQLHMTWPLQYPRRHVKVLTCAFDAMSLPFLTNLVITTDVCFDSWTWAKTFGKLPLLECVGVQGKNPHSFLKALIYKTKAATGKKSKEAYRKVSFPKLRYIRLVGTDFWGEDITVDVLLDYLMERCERNAAIHELHLNDCYYLETRDVERFREVVVDVIWDGEVKY
jgi:hypothetical protein